jgi:hypothetical protein
MQHAAGVVRCMQTAEGLFAWQALRRSARQIPALPLSSLTPEGRPMAVSRRCRNDVGLGRSGGMPLLPLLRLPLPSPPPPLPPGTMGGKRVGDMTEEGREVEAH